MIILGVDPGIARLGYGFIFRQGNELRLLKAGVLTTPPSKTVPLRLAELMGGLEELCRHAMPNRIVVERIFQPPGINFGRVSETRGIILLLAGRLGVPVEEISPSSLKALTTRSGKAHKIQMRKTVQRILGIKNLPAPDAADALALAIVGSSLGIRGT